ncbi:MAG: hypothetical protein PHN69_06270 [Candidatus Pacebacteria bacterium]|jgi:hypothetical protein|nr:hypothetical protein [Candidatus Paceibacterota bacterium]
MADFDLGKVNITEMIKITDSETGEVSYLIQKNDEWITITEEEYNKKLEG